MSGPRRYYAPPVVRLGGVDNLFLHLDLGFEPKMVQYVSIRALYLHTKDGELITSELPFRYRTFSRTKDENGEPTELLTFIGGCPLHLRGHPYMLGIRAQLDLESGSMASTAPQFKDLALPDDAPPLEALDWLDRVEVEYELKMQYT